MTRLETFDDVLALLTGDLEIFRYPAADLVERFGDRYRRDALAAFRALDRFAVLQDDSLEGALTLYADHLRELARERRDFMTSGGECGRQEASGGGLGDRDYLYALTLSTVLARSRYEVFVDYRNVLPDYVDGDGPILEIGCGNCLDAGFAAGYAPVDAYDINPSSRFWCDLLGLGERVRLRTERYDFSDAGRYAFVTMIELLEHVAEPAELLRGARRVLRAGSHAYLTFAVRMPQADHLYLFSSVDECRDLLADEGFVTVHEHCAVDTYMPYTDEQKWRLADETRLPLTFCCLARRSAAAAEALTSDFSRGFDVEGA